MLPWLIAVYLDIHQTPSGIQGRVRTHTIETDESQMQDNGIDITLYKVPENTSQRDWLKDVLVQVIEQL